MGVVIAVLCPALFAGKATLYLRCKADNDLYKVLVENGVSCKRFDTPEQAIRKAPKDAGVLILADEYPQNTTPLNPAIYEQAAAKKLRLYVEFPSYLPDTNLGAITYLKTGRYGAVIERTVVASDAFGPQLPKLRIMMIHDCHYLPVEAASPHLVLARVEGYDTAVYGLPKEVQSLLFEHPSGRVLAATTKLSQFVTARYAPTEAWPYVWQMILNWLEPEAHLPKLKWTPSVRPSCASGDELPMDSQWQAMKRGIEYYGKSRLYIHPSWPKDTGIDPLPADWPVGDGTYGIGECYISKHLFFDGSQSVSRSVRADCNLEAAMGLACGVALLNDQTYERTVQKLNDLVFFNSNICGGPRADPNNPAYGLIGSSTQFTEDYWGDDNARALLSALASAALIRSERWDEPILRSILGNFRTTGVNGYRPHLLRGEELQQKGWQHFCQSEHIDYCPHMQAWIWCTYLWLYDKTKYVPLLERARTGLKMMLAAYPKWRLEANRVETERCRMLLPLAWLLRVEDTAEHRQWLQTMADFVIGLQDVSGAIPQIPGHVIESNDGYGTDECAITHAAGDPATDALYAINFAFIGMHEAAAVTGDPGYAQSAEGMADFFIRTQTRSESHPELDGTWFRGFDFKKWDYWASDGDWGWGVWTNEIGWTHSWITATLALRYMKTSLWELTKDSRIAEHFEKYRSQMLREKVIKSGGAK